MAFVGQMFGSILLVPGLDRGRSASCSVHADTARSITPKLVVASVLVALLLPIGLELAGVLPRTWWLDDGTLVIRPRRDRVR